jgi:Tfp pilus assembly protein PilF
MRRVGSRSALQVAVVILLSATALSGCAARGSRFANRFVRPGEPTVSFDAPEAEKPREGLGEWARRLRTLQANARTKSSFGASIESHDRVLAAALLRLAMQESAENHRLVAAAYRNAGINDYAHRHLQRALRLEPCDAAAYDGLARLWRDWGHPELALGDSYRALHCSPNSPEIYNTLGTVFVALEQPENGRRAFARSVELNPRGAFALSNLCYVSLQQTDTTAARRLCAAALEIEPALSAARTNLALAEAIDGDVAGAEKRLMDAPNASQGYYNVGVLRLSLGQYGQAAEAFDQAVAEKPSLWIARERAVQARRAAAMEQD